MTYDVTHFPYIKLVLAGEGREQLASAVDLMRHAYFWPFCGLPGRHAHDWSLWGSWFEVWSGGPSGDVRDRVYANTQRIIKESFAPHVDREAKHMRRMMDGKPIYKPRPDSAGKDFDGGTCAASLPG